MLYFIENQHIANIAEHGRYIAEYSRSIANTRFKFYNEKSGYWRKRK